MITDWSGVWVCPLLSFPQATAYALSVSVSMPVQACGVPAIRECHTWGCVSVLRRLPVARRGRAAGVGLRTSRSLRCMNKPHSRSRHGWRGAVRWAVCLSRYSSSPESLPACPCRPASLYRLDVDTRTPPPYRCPLLASTPYLWRSMKRLQGKKNNNRSNWQRDAILPDHFMRGSKTTQDFCSWRITEHSYFFISLFPYIIPCYINALIPVVH